MNKENVSRNVDFSALVSGLMAEALASMGMLEHPSLKDIKKDNRHTQAVIDTISMLKEKTAGNLTPEESKLIDEVLHQLRMGYVSVFGGNAVEKGGEERPGDVS
jgi:hypothetical protein